MPSLSALGLGLLSHHPTILPLPLFRLTACWMSMTCMCGT